MCAHITVYTVIENTAQNSSGNLPSYPLDSHHWTDVVYWNGGKYREDRITQDIAQQTSQSY